MYIKDFTGWNTVKQVTEQAVHIPTFKEREIWWCKIGINVGHETDGKGSLYNRPVLIVKKFNSRIFWGVPTTTKVRSGPHYFQIDFRGRQQCVMLSHLRLYDSKRLQKILGTLPDEEFEAIKTALIALL